MAVRRKPARKTRYVLVTASLVLHFDEDLETLPRSLGSPVEGTCRAILHYMRAAGVPTVGFSDGRLRYGLYFPREKRHA